MHGARSVAGESSHETGAPFLLEHKRAGERVLLCQGQSKKSADRGLETGLVLWPLANLSPGVVLEGQLRAPVECICAGGG